MILYKGNLLAGRHEMTAQEIAGSFVDNADLAKDTMEYYGLHNTIMVYVSKHLGSWDAETEEARTLAQEQLIEIYDLVKPDLKEKKLGLWS